jgi:hypothetical protein
MNRPINARTIYETENWSSIRVQHINRVFKTFREPSTQQLIQMETDYTIDPSGTNPTSARVKHLPKRAMFFGDSVEVAYSFDNTKFDSDYSDGAAGSELLKTADVGQACTVPQWGLPPSDVPMVVSRMWVKRPHPDKPDAEVCTQIQLPESFIMDVGFTGERKDYNVSNTIDFNCDYGDSDPNIQMYGDMPADEEYNTYRGNGTYVDSEGLIKPSHLAKRALQTWEDSLTQAKADGTRFVLSIPSSTTLYLKFRLLCCCDRTHKLGLGPAQVPQSDF